MSDIVQRLTYALGNHHWGRSALLEEARKEILRLRRENASLFLEVPNGHSPIYRGKHLLAEAQEIYGVLEEIESR